MDYHYHEMPPFLSLLSFRKSSSRVFSEIRKKTKKETHNFFDKLRVNCYSIPEISSLVKPLLQKARTGNQARGRNWTAVVVCGFWCMVTRNQSLKTAHACIQTQTLNWLTDWEKIMIKKGFFSPSLSFHCHLDSIQRFVHWKSKRS